MGRETKAQYAKHYSDYQGTPEQIKKRAQRNAARSTMEKKHGKAAIAGKDVHHVKRISSGGSNSPSNLRLAKPSINRNEKKRGG